MNSYLEIEERTRAAIARAIKEAEANVTPFAAFRRETILLHHFGSTMSRPRIPSVVIPVGHCATIQMIELEPGRPFRHLCLSSPGEGPDRGHTILVAQAFGFRRPLDHCTVWFSEINSRRFAVNVLEPCDANEWYDEPAPSPLPAGTQEDMP